MGAPPLDAVFAILAMIFIGLAVRDYRVAGKRLTPRRKAWLLIGFIFTAVSIGLIAIQGSSP